MDPMPAQTAPPPLPSISTDVPPSLDRVMFERIVRLETRLPYDILALRSELLRALDQQSNRVALLETQAHREQAASEPIDLAGWIKLAMSAVFILAALQLVLSGKSDVAISAAGKVMGAH